MLFFCHGHQLPCAPACAPVIVIHPIKHASWCSVFDTSACVANTIHFSLPGPGPSPKRPRRDMEDTSMQPPSGKASQSLHGHINTSLSSIRLDRTSLLSPSPASSSGPKHARTQSHKSLASLTYGSVPHITWAHGI